MLKVPRPSKISVRNPIGISEFQIPFSEITEASWYVLVCLSHFDIVSSVPTRVLLAFACTLCVSLHCGDLCHGD